MFYSTEHLKSYFPQGKEGTYWVQTIALYLYLTRIYHITTLELPGYGLLPNLPVLTRTSHYSGEDIYEGNETKDS